MSEAPDHLFEIMKREQPDKGRCESNFNLANHEVFYRYASDALTLDSKSGVDDPIFEAFKEPKLNPVGPLHWRVLTTVLCWSLFPPKRSAGHPTFWNDERYCQLLREVHKLHGVRRKRSDPEACGILSEKHIFRDKGPLSGGALRRALQHARDPEYNGTLADHTNRGLTTLRQDYERRGHVWPPVDLEASLARVREVDTIEGSSENADRVALPRRWLRTIRPF
jgi:hypothetical protein